MDYRFTAALAALAFLSAPPVPAADPAAPPPLSFFEQRVEDSNPLRIAQVAELVAYIKAMQRDAVPLRSLLLPDYSSL